MKMEVYESKRPWNTWGINFDTDCNDQSWKDTGKDIVIVIDMI
jgi:hypothetical protein